MRHLVCTIILGIVLTASARSENWPEFRGPSGQGTTPDTKLPTEWSASKNVAWKQAIPGKGWSSPIVLDKKIYLTTAVPGGKKASKLPLRALCLDAATGKIEWDKDVFSPETGGAPKIHSKNSHASPTPITDGKFLYVHFGHQGTACLDMAGKVIWQKAFKYEPVHGSGGSPILVDDMLVFSCDGGNEQFVMAVDKATGKELWKTDRKAGSTKKFSFSTPLLITVKGQKQIISPGPGAVCAYEPKTGKEIWRVRYGDGYSVVPRPVFAHDLLFICTGYDSPSLLAIRPDGEGDVTKSHIAWTARKAVPLTPSLLVAGDELYMVSDGGVASCLDAKTGKVHWQERIGGNYSGSPLLADGKVYFPAEDGSTVIVKADKTFSQVAKNTLGERALASFAACDGALYIRTEKNLYRVEAGK